MPAQLFSHVHTVLAERFEARGLVFEINTRPPENNVSNLPARLDGLDRFVQLLDEVIQPLAVLGVRVIHLLPAAKTRLIVFNIRLQ